MRNIQSHPIQNPPLYFFLPVKRPWWCHTFHQFQFLNFSPSLIDHYVIYQCGHPSVTAHLLKAEQPFISLIGHNSWHHGSPPVPLKPSRRWWWWPLRCKLGQTQVHQPTSMPHYSPSTSGGATCYLQSRGVLLGPVAADSWSGSSPASTRPRPSSLSLSTARCNPWQTLIITARAADRGPGWVSALATVGTAGTKEGRIGGLFEGLCQKPLFWCLGVRSDDLVGDTGWWHSSWPLVLPFHCATCGLQRSRAAVTQRDLHSKSHCGFSMACQRFR